MADVSVEFGAKDTGLEQTLKTVQDELTRLNEEVKTGELSFGELQSAMRKVSQAEKLQEQLQGMAQATNEAGNAAGMAAPKVDDIGKQTKQAGKEADDFGEKSKGGFLKMSAAVAAGQLAASAAMAGIKAAVDLAKASIAEFGAALDLGGRLDDLSIQTGIAAGELLVLERAFQNSGAGADKVSTTISKVASAIVDASSGTGAASAAFDRLGLSASELINLPADKQFEKISAALSGVANQTERSALANDIFGQRLAKDLLPLISDFGGEINKAGGQLGSLPGIMNTAAASFAAIGENIKVVRGKFTEFASGILSAMTPALKAITEGLSRIDAAGLGRKLADAFLGGQKAMQGFQAAVDAFKIGEFGKAFELIFESIKLQLMQTGNAIITNFTAAFKTVGDIMAEIFRPDGPTFMVVRSAFDFLAGYAKEKIAGAMSDMFAGMGPAFSQTTEALKIAAEAGASSAEMALQRIPVAAGLAAEDIGNVLANSTQTFKDNLAESESKFFDIGEQSAKVKGLQDEIAAAVAKTNEEKGKGMPIDQQTADAATQQVNAAQEQANAAANRIQLQTDLNNAIASGNTAEATRLQKLLDGELAQVRINKLTEDYIKSGLGAPEALQLATNLVNSEIAAANVKKNSEGMKGELGGANKEAQTVKGLMDEIANAKMEASPERLKERTKDARKELEGMKNFIGEDLSKMPLDNIIDKLGLDPDGKLKTTNEKLKAVEGAIKDIGGADPADITPGVDLVGVNDKLESVKGYLAEIGKKKTDATPQIDQKDVAKQAKDAMATIESTMKKTPAEIALNAEKSVGEIRESLAKEIDVALSSSKGTEHLSSIDKLVKMIEGMVKKIEGKLPMQALA